MSTQPTILVKKADGSMVRMTLDEVKKMKATAPSASTSPQTASSSPRVDAAPDNVARQRSRDSLPAGRQGSTRGVYPERSRTGSTRNDSKGQRFRPEPQNPLQKADVTSPLEESLSGTSAHLPRTSQPRDQQVEIVRKKLSFAVPETSLERFRSVVQLFLKDVRGERETRDTLQRPFEQGGVGLTSKQVMNVIAVCQDLLGTAKAPLRTKTLAPQALPPAVASPALPATTTPYNAFVHSTDAMPVPPTPSAVKKSLVSRPAAPDTSSRASIATLAAAEKINTEKPHSFSLATKSTARVPMHEVLSPHREMTPVEELSAITLTDWRRLATSPAERAARLKQKFVNLREESILLFLEGGLAWRKSPLYQEYVRFVAEHLAKGQKITQGLGGPNQNQLALDELTALVSMEQEMNML